MNNQYHRENCLKELQTVLWCTFRAAICEKSVNYEDFFQVEALQRYFYKLHNQIWSLRDVEIQTTIKQEKRLKDEFDNLLLHYPKWHGHKYYSRMGIILEPRCDYYQRFHPQNEFKSFWWLFIYEKNLKP